MRDDAVVEYVFSEEEDGRIRILQIQCEDPMTHEEFLYALQAYLTDELTDRSSGTH